jgi:hypothetical protein
LRSDPHGVRVRLVRVPADPRQLHVGRRHRHHLDLRRRRRLVSAQDRAVPGFADQFDAAAPDDIKGFSPPFVGALQEPGVVQIWSGLVARTAPGWSLLVRGPANLPRNLAYEVYEGIVETDRWFGPLFTNIRLTRTNVPVELNPELPFMQVQPVNRELYGNALEQFELVTDLAHLRPENGTRFRRRRASERGPAPPARAICSCGTAASQGRASFRFPTSDSAASDKVY